MSDIDSITISNKDRSVTLTSMERDFINDQLSDVETVRVFGKYDLSEDEKREKSQELAETIRNLGLKQLEKKAVTKQFAADIEGLQETIEQLSGHIRDGYEMKPINCYRRKDYTRKRVLFVSVDTGDVVKTEPFTEADYQMGIRDGLMA